MMKKNQKNELEKNIKNELINYSKLDQSDLLKELKSDIKKGFSTEYAEDWQDEYGFNEVNHGETHYWYNGLFESFFNPFSIVLIVLAIISFITGDITAGFTISFLVFLSGIIKFVQEERSNNASEKLKSMISTTATVLRDGRKKEIPISEITKGDIIFLSAGDIIPADLRVLDAKDLFISQSSLTGESEPIEKLSNLSDEKQKNTPNSPLELENLCFMGTNVVSGMGTAVVLNIGINTYFGSMSKLIVKSKAKTSFDKGVSSVSWFLIRFMIVMVILVFLINGYTKNDWLEAFLFAISIAVGLTPEMLPVIVSANLAKGAIGMSAKRTIVKNLNSIQNFGAMDILCSDKTGTLTENAVVLQYHLNVNGQEDLRVLKHAYLNSNFQTGLKNLLDIAIIEKGMENNLYSLNFEYKKIDELPFDFMRRRMSIIIEDKKGKVQLITKGALKEMLQVCKWVEYNGEVIELTDEMKKKVEEAERKLSEDGMRVLALAQKNNIDTTKVITKDVENEMVLIGYLSFLDPPKQSSKSAIQALKDYNVRVKVLTGDSEIIAKHVCKAVGIANHDDVITGGEIEELDDEKLKTIVEKVDIFAKLSPQQKLRIIKVLKDDGHTVGFMGDGINDAPAMKEADVAISVDTAVDIAKESADIILLKKDLNVLVNGVIEGRKIFCNIIKYIKMTISSNFGNMFSVLFASAFLPFLPMLPVQILLLNIFYDLSQMTIPWDNIDEDYIKKQKKWDAKSIMRFMLWVGPTSSICDILLFLIMFNILGWNSPINMMDMSLFQTGWFVSSMITQTIITYLIRTEKIPFIQSNPSVYVFFSTSIVMLISCVLPYLKIGSYLELTGLPLNYYGWLCLIILLYILLVQIVKTIYIKIYKNWL